MAPARLAIAFVAACLVAAGCGGGGTKTVTETVRNGGTSTTPAFMVDVLGKRSEQPPDFAFSANGDLVAKDLHWKDWGQDTATASATFVFNPAPHTTQTTVHGKLVATDLERCRAVSYYTTTRLSFDERPPFQPQVPRLGTPCDTTPAASDAPPEPSPERPSAADADMYARRTYVVQPQLGKRVLKVEGPGATVTAADGSQITGFGAVLADSGDGTGQAVLLFRGDKFLGWASDRLAIHLSMSSDGDAIAVRYGNFQGDDPFCCPSSKKTVRYTWNGSRIVADGDPPLAYGKQGDPLHLASGG
ncbi:MAG: LppP/LprE family lipoprotein [Thermoleophilaceae bacterium]